MLLSKQPTLGVLITYHNEGDMLCECLASLWAQEEKPDEVLVYDDASQKPAKDYMLEGLPIQLIRGEVNRGPSHGRNTLLHVSQSQYIHFHDADDLFGADWCGRVRQAICDTEADLVFNEVASVQNSQLVTQRIMGLRWLSPNEDLVKFCIHGTVLTASTTMRKDCAIRIGGFREDLLAAEDWDFFIRLAASQISYTIVDEPLVIKRWRPDGYASNRELFLRSDLEATHLLAEELPEYKRDVADLAVQVGLEHLRNRRRLEAKEAFRLACEVGPPTYRDFGSLYRTLAKMFGPLAAEHIAMLYRNVVPERVRRLLSRLG